MCFRRIIKKSCLVSALSCNIVFAATMNPAYHWLDNPMEEEQAMRDAETHLENAIKNPEYMLDHWILLPTAPSAFAKKKIHYLSLREAILLSLRYNPNIRNAELDRIIQRYQLRLAQNAFELQYAIAGSAVAEKSIFSGVGNATTNSYLLTPEGGLKTKLGTQLSVAMKNNTAGNLYENYNPVLNISVTQPLLRGFGKAVNEAGLLDAVDRDNLNKLTMQQSVMDQITIVIGAYRTLVLSGNNLRVQRRQLEEAHKSFAMNKRKIAAGQLEPTGNIQQSYQIESLSLMVEQAENDFKTAALDLLQAIGLDPEMKLAVPGDVSLEKLVVPNLDDSINQALTHNVQYLAQKMALRADERAYTVAKNQQLWQLDASANVQSGNVTSVNGGGFRGIYNGRDTNRSAQLTLSVPLHDLNRRNQLITAKVQLEKDRMNLIASRNALITTVKNTINAIRSQIRQYELAKRQVALAEQSYALEKRKQDAGISSALDVNNTQNQLIQAQMGLISAKISYLNQLSTLQRILGTTLDYWHIELRYGNP